jgi:hypothetical protein
MKRWLGAALVTLLAACGTTRADEQEAKAVIDKAIKAMGGEEKLSKVKAFSTKGKGTIVIDCNDIAFTFETTAKGIGQYHSAFEGEADGNKFTGATVIDGDKGWRKLDENIEELKAEELANEKRNAYLEITPVLLVPLKGKGFKLDVVGEEKVDGTPTTAVRVTGPDGKDFTLYFDKERGLPIKLNGRVVDWQGQEFTQDTTFEEYKEFDGIKVATKSKSKKDGDRYVEVDGMEFKRLDEVDPDTFAKPR